MLLSCIFAQEFWFSLLQNVGLQHLCLQKNKESFGGWWDRIYKEVADVLWKGSIPS
jgi:hypothetical protein